MGLTLLDIAGHTSFALTALSFYLRDIILLRALAIVSGVVGIAYNFWLPAGPLWLVIFWLTVFIVINGVRIGGIVAEHRSVALSDEENELYEILFKDFSPVEFMKLMRISKWKSAYTGQGFAAQGKDISELIMLFNGEVRIERDGAEIGTARDGAMIGEISFIQGGAATADVTATRPCRYIVWPKDELRGLLRRNPNMDVAMKNVFSLDLMQKLTA